MRLNKLIIVPLIIALLSGCASKPLLTSTSRDVAAVLQPISKSNIVDSRSEFRGIYCAVNKDHGAELPDFRDCNIALHKLSDETEISYDYIFLQAFHHKLHVLILPGIFGECIKDEISPFSDAAEYLNRYEDIYVEIFPGIRGRASSKHNSLVIQQYLSNLQKSSNEKLIIVAYSKGTTDMLLFLSNDEFADSYNKIDALVSIAGVVNGSPLADDLSNTLKKLISIFPYEDCPIQDESGLEDLTRSNQLYRLSKMQLPKNIAYYSLPAYTDYKNTSFILQSSYNKLSQIDPRNDGQVIYFDSILPRAHLLGYANADHWAVALPFSRNTDKLNFTNRSIAKLADKNAYPREVLLESILRFIDIDLSKTSQP